VFVAIRFFRLSVMFEPIHKVKIHKGIIIQELHTGLFVTLVYVVSILRP